jgi:acyl-CoA-binding protein
MMVIQFSDYHTMTELNDAFENAQKDVKKLTNRPDDATLLKLYALYKQGSTGDVQGDKPGFFDFVGAAKYEAWEQLKGTSAEDAQQQYIDLVNKLSD